MAANWAAGWQAVIFGFPAQILAPANAIAIGGQDTATMWAAEHRRADEMAVATGVLAAAKMPIAKEIPADACAVDPHSILADESDIFDREIALA